MIKKALIGTVVLATLGTFVFGRDVISYAKTWASSARNAVKREVPVEFEVQRAREMIEELVPDIRNCMHTIAEQQVEIEDLNRQVAAREEGLADQELAIRTLRNDLDGGSQKLVYHGRTYTVSDVKRDLSTRFSRFKIAKDTLNREQQILRAKADAVAANEKKLENLLVEKQNLAVQIEQLEARMKSIQAVETVSKLEIDNSQLSRAKKLIRDLNKQLDVREKMLDAEGKFAGLIPVETSSKNADVDIAKKVDEYFQLNDAEETETQVVNLDSP